MDDLVISKIGAYLPSVVYVFHVSSSCRCRYNFLPEDFTSSGIRAFNNVVEAKEFYHLAFPAPDHLHLIADYEYISRHDDDKIIEISRYFKCPTADIALHLKIHVINFARDTLDLDWLNIDLKKIIWFFDTIKW